MTQSTNTLNTLQSKIDSLTSTNTLSEILLLAQAAKNTGNIRNEVNNLTDLPFCGNGTNYPLGTCVYVVAIDTILFAGTDGWYSFDGRRARQNDITTWGVGTSGSGQLGDNTGTASRLSPVSVVSKLKWKQVSAGFASTLFINIDNTIYGVGGNSVGQLGDGTQTVQSSPVSLIAPFNSWTWKQIETGGGSGGGNTLAIKSDGAIWGWGHNGKGQLGDGTTITKSSSVSMVSPCNSWSWIDVSIMGDYSAHAIKSDGAIWGWGYGGTGELGNGTYTTSTLSPVSLISPCNSWVWKKVQSGMNSVVALRSDDTIWGWGINTTGQLGNGIGGPGTSYNSPVSLISPCNSWTWKQISHKNQHTLAIKSDDTLWSWGKNDYGQLGDNTNGYKSSPVSVVGGFTWKQVSAGWWFSTAIKSDDTLWTWGRNSSGQLGDGTSVNKSSPVPVVAPANGWVWTQISAGGYHTMGQVKTVL